MSMSTKYLDWLFYHRGSLTHTRQFVKDCRAYLKRLKEMIQNPGARWPSETYSMEAWRARNVALFVKVHKWLADARKELKGWDKSSIDFSE